MQQPALELEIAHLLLIDIVGYSKLLANEQVESVQELGRIVRSTECFRNAEATGKLLRVPTGACMPKSQETSDILAAMLHSRAQLSEIRAVSNPRLQQPCQQLVGT